MTLKKSINEQGVHIPLELIVAKGNGVFTIIDPDGNEVKGVISSQDGKVTITTTLAAEFQ